MIKESQKKERKQSQKTAQKEGSFKIPPKHRRINKIQMQKKGSHRGQKMKQKVQPKVSYPTMIRHLEEGKPLAQGV